jgi:hypothetical protein
LIKITDFGLAACLDESPIVYRAAGTPGMAQDSSFQWLSDEIYSENFILVRNNYSLFSSGGMKYFGVYLDDF